MTPRRWIVLGIITLALPTLLPAQAGWEVTDRGVAAYRQLEFEQAIALLRRTLRTGTPTDAVRAEILGYIGAAQVHLEQKSAAAETFREALAAAPRYRVDTLVFPPVVSRLFEEVRAGTAFADIRTVADSTITLGRDAIAFDLAVSAPHQVRVELCDSLGACSRTLYRGLITDTLTIRWDGLAGLGAGTTVLGWQRVPLGDAEIRVHSSGDGRPEREVRLPLTVTLIESPTDVAALVGEAPRLRSASGPTALVGVAIALSAAVLPALVSTTVRGSDLRFGVSAAVVGATVIGSRSQRAGSRASSVRQASPAPPPELRIRTRPRTVVVGEGVAR